MKCYGSAVLAVFSTPIQASFPYCLTLLMRSCSKSMYVFYRREYQNKEKHWILIWTVF